jgi:uncharacterized protein RhaS with RHS repeats
MQTQMKLLAWLLTLLAVFLVPHPTSAYYDPGIQRWINRDPIDETGGVNLFQFVHNDPLSSIDPLGETVLDDLNDPCSKNALDKLEKGGKCYEEWQKHVGYLRTACKRLRDLEEKLKNTKGPKAQRPIKAEIEKVKNDIKGYEKEMKQKWPKGPPCPCP